MRHFSVIVITLALTLSSKAWAEPQGNPKAGKSKAAACAACHGVDGNSPTAAFPKLAGQVAEYTVKQLEDFKSGARKNAIMSSQVIALSKQDMWDIASYYSEQKIKINGVSKADLAKQGELLFRGGNVKNDIAACMACHGPSGHGIPPHYPRVSGQHAEYSKAQLIAFKNNERKNDNHVMQGIAFRMSLDEIRAVAEYMAGLN